MPREPGRDRAPLSDFLPRFLRPPRLRPPVLEAGRIELHARKSLCCCEQTFKDDSGEVPERKEETCRESLNFLNSPEQSVGRKMEGWGACVAQSVKRLTSARSRSRGPGVRAPRQALG